MDFVGFTVTVLVLTGFSGVATVEGITQSVG